MEGKHMLSALIDIRLYKELKKIEPNKTIAEKVREALKEYIERRRKHGESDDRGSVETSK